MAKHRCIECEFWTMGFDNVCMHPGGAHYHDDYCDSENEACKMFQKERVDNDDEY